MLPHAFTYYVWLIYIYILSFVFDNERLTVSSFPCMHTPISAFVTSSMKRQKVYGYFRHMTDFIHTKKINKTQSVFIIHALLLDDKISLGQGSSLNSTDECEKLVGCVDSECS